MRDQLQLRQPGTLENFAKNFFIKWMISPLVTAMTPIVEKNTFKIVKKAVDFNPEGVAALKKYVNNLPGLMQQKLLTELMEQLLTLLKKHCMVYRKMKRKKTRLMIKIVEEYNIIDVILGVLFTEKIKVLKLGYYEMTTFGSIFGNQGYLLGGLTDLRLDVLLDYLGYDEGDKYDEDDKNEDDEAENEEKDNGDEKDDDDDEDQTDDEFEEFYQEDHHVKESNVLAFLKNLHGLKHLSLKCCTDNILQCVIENCKLIEKLELYCDLNLKSDIVKLLARLSNLKSIDLHVSLLDIEKYGAEEEIKQFLEVVATQKQFYIRSYACYDTEYTLEHLQMVIKNYPLIQSLSLSSTDSRLSLERYKETLTGLKNLKELEMCGFDFYRDRVKEVLDSVGGNLKKLVLRFNSEIDLNAMKVIILNFPMLQELTIKTSFFEEMDTTSNLVTPNVTMLAFPHLQSFKVSSADSSKNHLPYISFVHSNCPNII